MGGAQMAPVVIWLHPRRCPLQGMALCGSLVLACHRACSQHNVHILGHGRPPLLPHRCSSRNHVPGCYALRNSILGVHTQLFQPVLLLSPKANRLEMQFWGEVLIVAATVAVAAT